MPFDLGAFTPPVTDLYEEDFAHLLSSDVTWSDYLSVLYSQAEEFVITNATGLTGEEQEAAISAYLQYLAFCRLAERPKPIGGSVRVGSISVAAPVQGLDAQRMAIKWAMRSATLMSLSPIPATPGMVVWGY